MKRPVIYGNLIINLEGVQVISEGYRVVKYDL